MLLAFSPYLIFRRVFRATSFQTLSSFSLLTVLNLSVPPSGRVAGEVITTLPRGKSATVPPKLSCSIVKKRSLYLIAARLAEKPAGPAPTIITSYAWEKRRPDKFHM